MTHPLLTSVIDDIGRAGCGRVSYAMLLLRLKV